MGKAASAPDRFRGRGNAEEAAFVDLLRTCELLTRPVADVLKTADLSPTQYNVLRSLRGAGEGITCSEIASRLITRDPDITRLLDRLEKRGLIARSREERDRRVVRTRITPRGLKLLDELEEPVQAVHRRQLGSLGTGRLRELRELLQAVRQEAE